MNIPKGGIAFFDSGIGGMTVLATCRKYLKNETLYYYGDNLRAPYGNLPPLRIQTYVMEAFDLFAALEVRAAVVACNTATAVCVEELRRRYPFPIVGAEPALRPAAKRGGEVMVLTTRATYESKRLQNLMKEVEQSYPASKICAVACDGLAGAIERYVGEIDFDYTSLLPIGTPDAVVLGCTHYVYIQRQIQSFYRCPVYHGNEGIAARLLQVLGKNREGRPQCIFDRRKQGLSTTYSTQKKAENENGQNTNESSCLNIEKCLEIQGEEGLFFLGESGKNNAKIYKQTYVRV